MKSRTTVNFQQGNETKFSLSVHSHAQITVPLVKNGMQIDRYIKRMYNILYKHN